MTHPDAAWSPICYMAPKGVPSEACRHSPQRMRIGPTGNKKRWMICVDKCGYCGHIMRAIGDLTWPQYDWIRRSNKRIVQ